MKGLGRITYQRSVVVNEPGLAVGKLVIARTSVPRMLGIILLDTFTRHRQSQLDYSTSIPFF